MDLFMMETTQSSGWGKEVFQEPLRFHSTWPCSWAPQSSEVVLFPLKKNSLQAQCLRPCPSLWGWRSLGRTQHFSFIPNTVDTTLRLPVVVLVTMVPADFRSLTSSCCVKPNSTDPSVRELTGTRTTEHVSPISASCHWLPLKSRVKFKTLLLEYKVLNYKAPSYVKELIITPTEHFTLTLLTYLCYHTWSLLSLLPLTAKRRINNYSWDQWLQTAVMSLHMMQPSFPYSENYIHRYISDKMTFNVNNVEIKLENSKKDHYKLSIQNMTGSYVCGDLLTLLYEVINPTYRIYIYTRISSLFPTV